MQIQNEIFTLTINEVEGWFSIEPKDKKLPGITHAFLGLKYRIDGEWIKPKFTDWQEIPGSRQIEDFGTHGKAEMIGYEVKTTDGPLVTFHFGIVLETPLVVWKVEVLNDRQQPIWLEKIDLLKVKESAGGKVELSGSGESLRAWILFQWLAIVEPHWLVRGGWEDEVEQIGRAAEPDDQQPRNTHAEEERSIQQRHVRGCGRPQSQVWIRGGILEPERTVWEYRCGFRPPRLAGDVGELR